MVYNEAIVNWEMRYSYNIFEAYQGYFSLQHEHHSRHLSKDYGQLTYDLRIVETFTSLIFNLWHGYESKSPVDVCCLRRIGRYAWTIWALCNV